MQRFIRYLLVVGVLLSAVGMLRAQTNSLRTIHEVKKKETVFGIAQAYGITIYELKLANPQLAQPDYKLKKGERLNIPFASQARLVSRSNETLGIASRPIRLGIMLPLHDINGDGRRMVEYYRGVLLACDSVKKLGISVDVHAWNVAENADINEFLAKPEAASLDLIIGPLYSKQVAAMSQFVVQNNLLMVIPFSIHAPELQYNPNMFQVYQTPADLEELTARRASNWFKAFHPVIIDCGDPESAKGSFTAALRKEFEQHGVSYSLTSLASSTNSFLNAFETGKRNVVIINSARTNYLDAVLGKLGVVRTMKPAASVSLLGYNEWLSLPAKYEDLFHTYDAHIPSTYYTKQRSAYTLRLKENYRKSFHQEMLPLTPRFALTGFDQAYFFLRGLNMYGKAFDGAEGRFGYPPVQTPLKFVRVGDGGFQNRAFMFVHYCNDRRVETINY